MEKDFEAGSNQGLVAGNQDRITASLRWWAWRRAAGIPDHFAYNISALAIWEKDANPQRHIEWTGDLAARIEPLSGGVAAPSPRPWKGA
jgi:hypothetical protein